jgi:hypothetical protein
MSTTCGFIFACYCGNGHLLLLNDLFEAAPFYTIKGGFQIKHPRLLVRHMGQVFLCVYL